MKKLLILIILCLLLIGCQKEEKKKPKGCDLEEICNKADMKDYELYDENEDYVFIKSDVKTMVSKMDNGDTFVIYYGFAKCPWCRDLMPILNQSAKELNYEMIYYVDTRSNENWKSNIDIDDYDLFVLKVGDYLELDENNIKHLYTPFVIFIKDGKIIKTISAPDYEAHKETISEELKEELHQELISAFKLLD